MKANKSITSPQHNQLLTWNQTNGHDGLKGEDRRVNNWLRSNITLCTGEHELTKDRKIEQRGLLTWQHQTPSNISNQTSTWTIKWQSKRCRHPTRTQHPTRQCQQISRWGININFPSRRRRGDNPQTRNGYNNNDNGPDSPRVQTKRIKTLDNRNQRLTNNERRKQSVRSTLDHTDSLISTHGSGIPSKRYLDQSH